MSTTPQGVLDLLEYSEFIQARFESKALWALDPDKPASKPEALDPTTVVVKYNLSKLTGVGTPTRPATILDKLDKDSTLAVKRGAKDAAAAYGSTFAGPGAVDPTTPPVDPPVEPPALPPFAQSFLTDLLHNIATAANPVGNGRKTPAPCVELDTMIMSGEALVWARNAQAAYVESSMTGFERRLRVLSWERGMGRRGGVLSNVAAIGQVIGSHLGYVSEEGLNQYG